MNIWIVTYGDGYTFSGVFVEAYDDKTVAELRCLELNEKYGSKHDGYDVHEYELNSRDSLNKE